MRDLRRRQAARVRGHFAAALLCWSVAALPVKAIDGDSLIVLARVWPSVVKGGPVIVPERVRVLGVNTPERGQPGYAEATTFTAEWIGDGELRITVCEEERDSFGRLLATVIRKRDGANLTTDLLASGHAVPFKR